MGPDPKSVCSRFDPQTRRDFDAGSYLFFEENAYHVTDRTRTKHPEPRQPWNQLLEKADALLSDGVLSAKSVEHIPRYHSARSGGVALSESTLNRVHSYPGEHGRGGGLQVADYGETSTHDKHCRVKRLQFPRKSRVAIHLSVGETQSNDVMGVLDEAGLCQSLPDCVDFKFREIERIWKKHRHDRQVRALLRSSGRGLRAV